MRNLTIAFAITTALAFAASFAPPVLAAATGGIGGLTLPAPTSPVEPAACSGRNVRCPPGRYWACGPYGHHCWCAPC